MPLCFWTILSSPVFHKCFVAGQRAYVDFVDSSMRDKFDAVDEAGNLGTGVAQTSDLVNESPLHLGRSLCQ
jgi:hypothetical protein